MKESLILKKNVVLVFKDVKTIRGLRTAEPAIVVAVTRKVPAAYLAAEDMVPKTVDGMPTDVIQTPMPVALRTSKYRPMPGGVSGGHPKVTAGTVSPLTVDGIKYIISNSHVIANCGECEMGDETWQPGRVDGGSSADTIGHLWRWAELVFEEGGNPCPFAQLYVKLGNWLARMAGSHQRVYRRSTEFNKVDCALSVPMDPRDLLDEILEIGVPAGFAEAVTGEFITKSGRTSLLTKSTVIDTAAEARVSYGNLGTALFNDQILTGKLAEPGDSGSLTFNGKTEVNGLLFAGSDEFTIVNKIQNVLEALGLEGGS